MKKSKIVFACFIFFLAGIFLVSTVFSFDAPGISLHEGKNNVLFNATNAFYVSDLVKLNPRIEAVSLLRGNESIGYVNFLGGIGENFVIENGTYCEIFMNENATIILPN